MTAASAVKSYLDMPLGRFLDAVAAPDPTPGGGAVSAVAVGLAAALAGMAAGFSSDQLPDAPAVAARAQELRARAAPLAEQDAAAYSAVLAALARPKDDLGRLVAVGEALSRAADVPLEIAGIASAVVELAERLEREGNPHLRGDATTARLLAAAAVRSAAGLVEINLSDPADPRLVRARSLADEAGRRSL